MNWNEFVKHRSTQPYINVIMSPAGHKCYTGAAVAEHFSFRFAIYEVNDGKAAIEIHINKLDSSHKTSRKVITGSLDLALYALNHSLLPLKLTVAVKQPAETATHQHQSANLQLLD